VYCLNDPLSHITIPIAYDIIVTGNHSTWFHLPACQFQFIGCGRVCVRRVDVDPIEVSILKFRQHLSGITLIDLHRPVANLLPEFSLHFASLARMVSLTAPDIDQVQLGRFADGEDLFGEHTFIYANFCYNPTLWKVRQ